MKVISAEHRPWVIIPAQGFRPLHKVRKGQWDLRSAIDFYHKKHGLEFHSEEYSHTFADGSVLTVTIETAFQEVEIRDGTPKAERYPDCDTWPARIMTKSFIISEWESEGHTFRTVKAAQKHIREYCESNEELQRSGCS